jgi:geranylgeranyl reductase family protein
MLDVIIAGAGPAGLHAARRCEEAGLEAVVLEEHAETGKPCHCSGLISKNLQSLVPVRKDFVEHRVRGAVMHSPNGKTLKLEKQGMAAYVIDRAGFDRFLASRLKSEIIFKSAVDGMEILGDRVIVKSGKKSFEAKALLACDGANSPIRKTMGARPKEMLNGLIAVRKERDYGEFVELWLDRMVCDGFLWRIPRGKKTEYGMMGTDVKFIDLERFFKLNGRYEKHAGIIPLGPPRTYFDRVLLVGDAAAQVKPWSGGGVIYSLTAAEIAAKTLKQARLADDFSAPFLKRYEQGWKNAFGRQIRAGMLARRVFKRMSNAQVNLALSSASKIRLLMNKLDMDYLVK